MADATNQTEPTPGYQLSGDATRQAAIARIEGLKKKKKAV